MDTIKKDVIIAVVGVLTLAAIYLGWVYFGAYREQPAPTADEEKIVEIKKQITSNELTTLAGEIVKIENGSLTLKVLMQDYDGPAEETVTLAADVTVRVIEPSQPTDASTDELVPAKERIANISVLKAGDNAIIYLAPDKTIKIIDLFAPVQ